MEWGILFVLVLLLFTGYVIMQETRAQLHWRKLVEEGDVEAIRQLVEGEIEGWHSQRVPRGTPALIWHGIQTVELLDVDPTAVHVSCNADGEFALIEGKRVETSSPLNEGMKITKKLAEMLLYDVPNVKLDRTQIDVYTSFRNQGGEAETYCILSTAVARHTVEHIDWDETDPADFVTLNQGHFGDGHGLQGIEPIAWPNGTARSS